jgi:hypothetical protein
VRSDFEDLFVSAIQSSPRSTIFKTPEQEFLSNWHVPAAEWKKVFEGRIENYFTNLHQKAKLSEGFDAWVRLGESRRRCFRKRPLAEFRLTIPVTNIPVDAPSLTMNSDGTVQ